ncbi:PTS fructose transporter subunit IIABC [Staphylococcus lutrae]|uniref:PTS fructose transporter subunit IIC n=1 Tax=Staphylococcus lutrae TaxID=155085 RepID=A0AAC9RRW8_9STAP|nr:fructose-specific PTS transporter subunit EIIC [Staphylococcus lutrae]ARJ51238.1 PTS fructose transporter subunit IIC [Staphylococcus lutrae]PNZ39483.1 PTS fructose transporter subunit IIC [Staphylococcus lutrae]
MRITTLLTKETIAMNLTATSKAAVINELAQQLNQAGKLNDLEGYIKAIQAREQQSSTGVGEGIAIPHAKVEAVNTPAIAFGKTQQGIDYESLDGAPAHLFFMIAAPATGAQTHLDALAKLSGILMHAHVRQQLLDAETPEDVLAIIDQADEAVAEEAMDVASETVPDADEGPYVLAVTACPTGIAHTYMARDALKKQAEAMGVRIKVETNGASGIKNKLTAQDIERATGVIVAADVHVEMNRFNGKNVVEVSVADGIKKPEALIRSALDTSRPPFVADHQTTDKKSAEKLSVGKTIYKHLMNGVSNMLPLVIAGGILMAIVFMIHPDAMDPSSSHYNAFAATLWEIGNKSAFTLIIPILSGYIARSIADKPGFAAGLVGGMLAVSGHSGFLGGIIAGFLAGYLTLGIKKVTKNFPEMLEGLKPTLIYPIVSVVVTGLLMIYIFNTPAAWLNNVLTSGLNHLSGSNVVILGIVIGGMMAIDMGGPFNKAAYVFSTAALTAGNASPITAAMVGGMVPPIAVAIAMMIFRAKFTKEQRGAIVPNFIMGGSFITEGAIPFAAADPLRVIPSMMLGSGISGGLALLWGASIKAPHGGLFVIIGTDPGHALLTILAILIGSVVSAVCYGILKPSPSQI